MRSTTWFLILCIAAFSALPAGTAQAQGGTAETAGDTLLVFFDVKPGTCPNPVNARSRGTLPVAILGTADLDVRTIDPTTLLIDGSASPQRWSIEDVASPFTGDAVSVPVPFSGDLTCDDCLETAPGGDGVDDLTLKFEVQDVIAAVDTDDRHGGDGEPNDHEADDDGPGPDHSGPGNSGPGNSGTGNSGQEHGRGKRAADVARSLTLTGNLLDGTPIKGVDVVCLKRSTPDFDGDDHVGFSDFVSFADQFGRGRGHIKFEARFDLDDDGQVGFQDFLAFVQAFVDALREAAGAPSSKPSVLPSYVGGQEPLLAISRVTGSDPDLTTVRVRLTDPVSVKAYQVSLAYDPALLVSVGSRDPHASQFGSGEGTHSAAVHETVREGQIVLADVYRDPTDPETSDALVDLTFRVLGDLTPGSLLITGGVVLDGSGNSRPVAMSLLGGSALLPEAFDLGQNFPNPFNPTTQIAYQMPEPGDVSIDVYSALGQRLVTLVRDRVDAGFHSVVWDGRDGVGRPVGSGLYFVRMQTGSYTQVRKMILLK